LVAAVNIPVAVDVEVSHDTPCHSEQHDHSN
jgi:hypothetical protein